MKALVYTSESMRPTIVIDDKWQQSYGTFEVDPQKWPDLKGFIAAQHAKGRHVLLWVPVADPEGLPTSLCVNYQGKCQIADVGNLEYEAYLGPRIQHLVKDLGVDGFKEDWVRDPAAPNLPITGSATGIEFVRRFQSILYTETHKWKPDAMVETQTANALFRDSSDVIRLNDIWYASRDVPEMMRLRGRIANITGWPVVDTDNASSTTLKNWWEYMLAQPTIGIPALYFCNPHGGEPGKYHAGRLVVSRRHLEAIYPVAQVHGSNGPCFAVVLFVPTFGEGIHAS